MAPISIQDVLDRARQQLGPSTTPRAMAEAGRMIDAAINAAAVPTAAFESKAPGSQEYRSDDETPGPHQHFAPGYGI
ncbi:hypothetical protein AB0I35_15675 [Nocardia sp. NPDC050378]|uniref:hypothetical protein n=1 Tax=Nocardia sp. NPDC050378 TaxID=3155400 RepID=UPI0033F1DB8B